MFKHPWYLVGGRTRKDWRKALNSYEPIVLEDCAAREIVGEWLAAEDEPFLRLAINTVCVCFAIGALAVTAIGLYFAYQLVKFN